MTACFNCGTDTNLIKHHLSYEPEIMVDCCYPCHCNIHQHKRIDRTGLMSVSCDDLKISHKSSTKRYHDQTTQLIDFTDGRLKETIRYNNETGTVSYSSRFDIRYGHGHLKSVPVLEE